MRKLGVFFGLLLFVGCPMQQPAQAQFIGFVSPQTTREQPFDDVGVGTFLQTVADRAQNTHIFNYRVVSGTLTDMAATIEGSLDGINFFTISDTARALTEGITTASGWYPIIRCKLVITGTSPVVDGFYAGTSIALERPRGLSDASGIGVTVITTTGNAAITGTAIEFNPVNRNIGGQLIFNFAPLTAGPGQGCRIEIATFTATQDISNARGLQTFPLAIISTEQKFILANLPADKATARYTCDTFPTSGTYTILHIAGTSILPQGHYFKFNFLSAVGMTAEIPVAVPSSISDDGARQSYTIQRAPKTHTVQLDITGGPTTCTFQLEGSLDKEGVVGGDFFDLSGPQDCTNDIMFHVTDRPVAWIRGNLTALSGGAGPALTVYYLGIH